MTLLKKSAQAEANQAAVAEVMGNAEVVETKGTPVFEAEEETTTQVTEQPAATEAKHAEPEAKIEPKQDEAKAQEAAAEAPKTTAVSVLKGGGILAKAGKGNSPLAGLKDALGGIGVNLEFDTFPRYKIEGGVIANNDGDELGNWVNVKVLSWSHTWLVTSGVDGEEGKKLVKYSKDGVTISSSDEYNGTLCTDYVQALQAQGYEKASIKQYTDIVGFVVECAVPDAEGIDQIVALSLSPQSRKAFEAYMASRSVRAAMGRLVEDDENPVLRMETKRVKMGSDVFFKYDFSEPKSEVAA